MQLLFVLILMSLNLNLFSQKVEISIYELEDIQLANPDTIFAISLAKQKLSKLPSELWKFKKLKMLNLQRNKLEVLPDSLDQFIDLESIDISHNRFSIFPLAITRLYNLKTLKAANNNLTFISENIEHCANLEYIDFYNNSIENIGNGIYKLKKLKLLDLRGVMYGTKFQALLEDNLLNVKVKMDPPCKCMD